MAVLDLGKVVPEKGTDYFTEQDIEEIVSEVKSEITVPTKTSDLTNDSGFIDNTVNNLVNYELKTNTGATIELSINSSTYVMTMVLKNSSGTALSTQTVDLPLESVVVSGSYDNINKKIVLTLQNGSTIDVPVGDLVSGLQAEITSNNKLSSDLVDDTNHTNLFVTASEKTTWNNKSDFSGSYNDLTNKPDLSVYATNSITGALADLDTTDKTNLVNAINEVASGGDLSNYYTKSEINNKFYENNAIYTLNAELGSTLNTSAGQYYLYLSNSLFTTLWNIYDDAVAKNYNNITIRISDATSSARIPYIELSGQVLKIGNSWDRLYSISPVMGDISNGGSIRNKLLNAQLMLSTNANVSYIVFSEVGNLTSYLRKDNATAFTPTGNYNPATKKYVDDAIASAITTTLQGGY